MIKVPLTLPTRLSFSVWATQLIVDMPYINVPIPPDSEEGWWDWAEQLVYSNLLFDAPLPSRLTYDTKEKWRDWAERFIGLI